MELYHNHYLGRKVIVKEPIVSKIKRTWKERFFTLPFRPFKRFNDQYTQVVPDGKAFVTLDAIIMNPQTYQTFKKGVLKNDNYKNFGKSVRGNRIG